MDFAADSTTASDWQLVPTLSRPRRGQGRARSVVYRPLLLRRAWKVATHAPDVRMCGIIQRPMFMNDGPIRSLMEPQDPEISVMSKIGAALTELKETPEAVVRVLRWAVEKYRPKAGPSPTRLQSGLLPDIVEDTEETSAPRQFPDFPALFAAAAPTTDPERALVAGYWFQVVNGHDDLHGQLLNDELKNMGHRIGNVTEALSNLIARRPALVIQTRKSGTSRQARKKYRLTTEGIRAVEQMLTQTATA